MVYMNTRMKKLLEDMKGKKVIQTRKQCELNELMRILWPDFIEVEDCILIMGDSKPERVIDIMHVLGVFQDRTGFEAFDSHIHIMDLISSFINRPKDGFRFALKLIDMWGCKLKKDFPLYRFHLILSFDGKDSILRFHRLRENESTWCNINNLDEYKNCAVMVKEV